MHTKEVLALLRRTAPTTLDGRGQVEPAIDGFSSCAMHTDCGRSSSSGGGCHTLTVCGIPTNLSSRCVA
jgi:hypothetical protein